MDFLRKSYFWNWEERRARLTEHWEKEVGEDSVREKESARKEESHENKAEVFTVTQDIRKGREAFGPFEFVTEYAVDHKVDTAVERYLDVIGQM